MTSTLHIVVAMKPLDGNFASNAIKYGVAGLNIDACRIGFTSKKDFDLAKFGTQTDIRGGGLCTKRPSGGYVMAKNVEANLQGRFPANVILEDKESIKKAFPFSHARGNVVAEDSTDNGMFGNGTKRPNTGYVNDTGSAARFFKQVKES
jgi:hypothetical protein